MNPLTLDAPRWPGGPPICPEANLPAFESAVEARKFLDRYPAAKLDRIVECVYCGGVHVHTHPRAASGDSSGTSKQSHRLSAATERHNAELSARQPRIQRRGQIIEAFKD